MQIKQNALDNISLYETELNMFGHPGSNEGNENTLLRALRMTFCGAYISEIVQLACNENNVSTDIIEA